MAIQILEHFCVEFDMRAIPGFDGDWRRMGLNISDTLRDSECPAIIEYCLMDEPWMFRVVLENRADAEHLAGIFAAVVKTFNQLSSEPNHHQ